MRAFYILLYIIPKKCPKNKNKKYKRCDVHPIPLLPCVCVGGGALHDAHVQQHTAKQVHSVTHIHAADCGVCSDTSADTGQKC